MNQTSIDWKYAAPAALLGVLMLGNGVYMLINPESWYWAVEGVADRGAFNQHFIRDIGIVYAFTSIGIIVGAFRPGERLAFWLPALCWHAGHALFHIWEVIVGICGPEALLTDFAGVILPAIVLALLMGFTRNEPRPA